MTIAPTPDKLAIPEAAVEARVKAIALIIDPHAFAEIPPDLDPPFDDMVRQDRDLALRKAQRIAALPHMPEEGIERRAWHDAQYIVFVGLAKSYQSEGRTHAAESALATAVGHQISAAAIRSALL